MTLKQTLDSILNDLTHVTSAIASAITAKGVSVPPNARLSEMPACISAITAGGEPQPPAPPPVPFAPSLRVTRLANPVGGGGPGKGLTLRLDPGEATPPPAAITPALDVQSIQP